MATIEDEIEMIQIQIAGRRRRQQPTVELEAQLEQLQNALDTAHFAKEQAQVAAVRRRQAARRTVARSAPQQAAASTDNDEGGNLHDRKHDRDEQTLARRRGKIQRVATATDGHCRNLHSSGTTGDSSKAAIREAQKEVRAAYGSHPVAVQTKKNPCRHFGTATGCENGDECGYQHSVMVAEKNRNREMRQQQSADGSARDPRRLAANQGGRRTGVVRRWLDDKAFGFIGVPGGAKDLCFHKNNTALGEMIAVGRSVEFIVQLDRRSTKGEKAAYQVYPLN